MVITISITFHDRSSVPYQIIDELFVAFYDIRDTLDRDESIELIPSKLWSKNNATTC